MGSALNDILSAHSYYQNKAAGRGPSGLGGDLPIFSPLLAGSPGAPHPWEDGMEAGLEHQIRYQQYNGALLGEIGS